ncbi:Vta1 like-domain-containing protein [Chiua virens]|nr:Vta1 like-domain-containing protein [Chiua virens]
MSLGLPPVSTGLKSIAPYLQRAEELVDREPVVAYWCAYYAAQLGVSLKAQDANSRNLLLNLIDALERLKKEVGPNDTIDIEPASAAYVENFALRVFKMADDEDRAGKASKATAKKFLAAANFFEVLRVFPTSDVSESTEGKLKYAKWKAADIAKAFRQGRRPTPGPAGSELDPDLTSSLPASDQFGPKYQPPTPPKPVPREPSPPTKPSSRSPKRQSPPPSIPTADIARANRLPIQPGDGKHDDEALSPGRWSTTATPGRTPGEGMMESTAGSYDSLNGNWHEHLIDPMSRAAAQGGSGKLRSAWDSTEMEGAPADAEHVRDAALNVDRGRGRVRFSIDAPDETSLPDQASTSPFILAQDLSSPPPVVSDLPPGFVPTATSPYAAAAGTAVFGSPNAGFVVPPPPVPHSAPTFSVSLPPVVPSALSAPPAMEAPPFPPPPPRDVELTPKLISKVQKHCKHAISALDYEDTKHAIKELKAALETLGVSV